MSKLSQKIAKTPPTANPPRRGPANRCFPLYGAGDLEDFQAIEALKDDGHAWRAIQAHVDGLLGIERSITLDAFRRHWRRRCFCWPEDLRL